jgi:hypothetical protein
MQMQNCGARLHIRRAKPKQRDSSNGFSGHLRLATYGCDDAEEHRGPSIAALNAWPF